MNPSPLGIHSHFSANGQCEIGSAMSGGKAVKARDAERGEKGFNHFPKREGRFVAAGFGEPEIRENHSPHMFKLAGQPQLIQHAVDGIHFFIHIFQKQNFVLVSTS